MKITTRPLLKEIVPQVVEAFAQANWHKPTTLYEEYLQEQSHDQRLVWVAFMKEEVAGYVTLLWESQYSSFREKDTPEIMDLNVLPQFRNQGIGSNLLDLAESAAGRKRSSVGLGVGLYAGYGAAQRLYVKKGFIPDGQGLTYQYQPLLPGIPVALDDDLVLWFTKKLA